MRRNTKKSKCSAHGARNIIVNKTNENRLGKAEFKTISSKLCTGRQSTRRMNKALGDIDQRWNSLHTRVPDIVPGSTGML